MPWYSFLAYFFAGVFLVNGIPHFVQGISGNEFSTPFAKPPGVGESSAVVNVIWGMVNFGIGYALMFGVGKFRFGLTVDVLMVGIGALVTAIGLAWQFGRSR
jgi:hypothetical protein